MTPEEKARDQPGILSTQFQYDESVDSKYPSSLPGFFPDIPRTFCHSEPFNLPTLGDGVSLILGLLNGVHLGVSALAGFPSLQTIPHQGALGFHAVNVFQAESRNQSMVVTIDPKQERRKAADIAASLIGQRTYHSWPYLQEGLIAAVSDDLNKYELQPSSSKILEKTHSANQAIAWKKASDNIEDHYSKRYGVIMGAVEVVLHVRPLRGEIGSRQACIGAKAQD